MKYLTLAKKFLWRDIRAGELTLLTLALLIAISSTTAMTLFSDRLNRTMSQEAATFLAADLVITSPEPIPDTWLKQAGKRGLKSARTAEFSTVLMENDNILLAGVKAVSSAYPLRGVLKTIDENYQENIHHQGPKAGQAWVERRILSALKLKLGDVLQVGEKKLTVSQILSYEPDKRGDLYSLSPRVMINWQDLAATEVIQPGSHVHYFFQFSGPAEALLNFSRQVKPHLSASQRIMDIHQDRPQLGAALERAQRYLGLSSIVVVLIAGVAIAMSARRYSQRHFNTSAILRCLGLKQQEVLAVFVLQFVMLGLACSLLGMLLGWLGQEMLFGLLRDFFPSEIALPGLFGLLFGFVIGLTILFGFALPPLLRLKYVSPLRVLRRDLAPLPAKAWLVYGLAVALVAGLTGLYTEDLKMTAILFTVSLLFLLLLGLSLKGVLAASRRLLPLCPLPLKISLRHLTHPDHGTVPQILAFSLTLMAMLISLTVRTDLLDDWKKQLPEQAPNHFALNIFPQQKAALEQLFKQQNIQTSAFYPVVRARLIKINDIPVKKIVSKDSQGERATHRDLSLTWNTEIPDDNQIVAGHWWSDPVIANQVSVESKLAKSLKLKLNDRLTFSIGSRLHEAVVTSLRKVRWDTMKPNFYFIFSPGSLDDYAYTYITSFFLPPVQKNFLNILVKQFPATTILEVDQLLAQFKKILQQLTAAINFLLIVALLAGFTVLLSAVYSSLDERIYQGALFRTLGASRSLIRRAQFYEFLLLGGIASVTAVMLSELILFAVYHYVLHLNFHFHGLSSAITIFGVSLFIALTGFIAVRKVVTQPPIRILQQ
jgi:putative ABC transport system permease protein